VITRAAFREFPDREAALNEVIQGRAHAYVHEEFDVRLACAKRPDVLIGRFIPLTFEPIAWAIAPGDSHWLNWLNNVILAMQRDGRLDELRKKWLHDYYLDLVAQSR
jgi:polar amino acid transport system substrate-binding protein